ncbi:MAG: S-methyl-5-thioribose-1-phosphate isomerase [Clostridia bacterium]|nr:S-methyl-5-thioribose-1-phosphate isomerase [Clostridia bacterium]
MDITNADRLACSVHLSPDAQAVEIIDQTQLPNRTVLLRLTTLAQVYDAIRSLAVRGAPAIGICAGYAMYILALQKKDLPRERFLEALERDGEYLISSRPTAVNLAWAVKRMLRVAASTQGTAEDVTKQLYLESLAIHDEDIRMCRRIAEYGLSLVKPGDGILTHCNAGPLATSRYGTATGPIFLGKERGIDFHVFADETRPLLQGARLTSYELHKAGIDVTLICDNMASLVMRQGRVQAVFVGCDRIAANGDFANKIGTSGVAILAKYYGIPFYTLGPTSTIDMHCKSGSDITIEERDGEEIRSMWYAEPMAPAGVKCFNPAFDVTDHTLLTAIVTDRGIVYPPFAEGLKKIMEASTQEENNT